MLKKLIAFFVGNAPDFTILIAALIIGTFTGVFLSGLHYGAEIGHLETQIATLKKNHAEEKAAAASDALQRLQAAQKKGDELTAQIAAAESEKTRIALEKDREIKKLTTNRRCLDHSVARLLNDPAAPDPDLRLPPATSEPAPAAPAAAADTAYVSDTGIALWARHARDQYDTCRERIDALRSFFMTGG